MSGWSLKEIKDKNATVIGAVQKVLKVLIQYVLSLKMYNINELCK
jgi:hypothetical protein